MTSLGEGEKRGGRERPRTSENQASYDSNTDELFQALGWRKLKYQRLESAAVMMYKSLHGMTPEYLTSRFVSKRHNIISIKKYRK